MVLFVALLFPATPETFAIDLEYLACQRTLPSEVVVWEEGFAVEKEEVGSTM